jgi:hypothetical protein
MPDITLTFANTLNTSVQVGDTAYYCSTTSPTTGFTSAGMSDIVEIGEITSITGNVIVCTIPATTVPPTDTSFILFSKDNKVNMSSPLGYYGLAQFKNESKVKGEMFAASCDVFESSK